MLTLPEPSVDEVEKAIGKFDEENKPIEWLLTQLFSRYPLNINETEVLVKAKVLNSLYNTNILAINSVASHIAGLDGLDSYLAMGSPQAVEVVAKVKFREKERYNFSFASKYCSWHNPNAYPIYDSRVDECLWFYKQRDHFAVYHRQGPYNYQEFVRIVGAFRDHFGLGSFNFKQLDKFLFLRGEALINERVAQR